MGYKPVESVEPMVNMYDKSVDYGIPFGIRIHYRGGRRESFCGNPEYALCAPLTKKQRKYAEQLIADIERKTRYTQRS